MRRFVAVLGVAAAVGLAGCSGTESGTQTKPAPTPITAPATKARGVVDQQNAQLKQMEQQTGAADPTAVP